MLLGEAEFLLQYFQWSRRPKRLHADDGACETDIVCPPESRGLFNRYASRHRRRQHLVAIGLLLLLEQFPRGHAHDPSPDAVGLQLFIRGDAERNLTAGSDEDHVRPSIRVVSQDVGSLSQARSGRILTAI